MGRLSYTVNFERVQTITIALILRPTELPYIQFLRDVRRAFAILCTRDVAVDREPCRRRSIERALEGIHDEAANDREKLREGVYTKKLVTNLYI